MTHDGGSVGDMASVYQPLERLTLGAHVDSLDKYKEMYARSLKDPEVNGPGGRCRRPGDFDYSTSLRCRPALQGFWGEFASQFHWNKKWDSGENFHK